MADVSTDGGGGRPGGPAFNRASSLSSSLRTGSSAGCNAGAAEAGATLSGPGDRQMTLEGADAASTAERTSAARRASAGVDCQHEDIALFGFFAGW